MPVRYGTLDELPYLVQQEAPSGARECFASTPAHKPVHPTAGFGTAQLVQPQLLDICFITVVPVQVLGNSRCAR